MVADRWLSLALSCLVLIGALLLVGCAIIPTPPHVLGVVPDTEAFESLRPGTSTRADVLLLLGEPDHRFDADRFFMYEWTVVYGYAIWSFPPPIDAGYGTISTPHYLCLEFERDSGLARHEKLTGALYEAIRRCTKQPEDLNIGDKPMALLNIQYTGDNQPYESFPKPTPPYKEIPKEGYKVPNARVGPVIEMLKTKTLGAKAQVIIDNIGQGHVIATSNELKEVTTACSAQRF